MLAYGLTKHITLHIRLCMVEMNQKEILETLLFLPKIKNSGMKFSFITRCTSLQQFSFMTSL
jgi:hypothetical protein